jgi:DNA-binding MarR family transcriptional regulator
MKLPSDQSAADSREAALSWSDVAPLVQALAYAVAPLSEASLPVRTRLDLGPRGTMILNQITSGRVQPSEIAKALNVGRSLISSDLARLEKIGLVARTTGKDRRSAELALTKKGLGVMFEVKANLERLIQERIGHYTKAELDFCTKVLTDLRGTTSPR